VIVLHLVRSIAGLIVSDETWRHCLAAHIDLCLRHGRDVLTTGDFTTPSAHSIASANSNNSSCRAVRRS
jgi:hypothetical protein